MCSTFDATRPCSANTASAARSSSILARGSAIRGILDSPVNLGEVARRRQGRRVDSRSRRCPSTARPPPLYAPGAPMPSGESTPAGEPPPSEDDAPILGLERFAALSADIESGAARDEVIAREGLSVEA